jgi:hypothetical protein
VVTEFGHDGSTQRFREDRSENDSISAGLSCQLANYASLHLILQSVLDFDVQIRYFAHTLPKAPFCYIRPTNKDDTIAAKSFMSRTRIQRGKWVATGTLSVPLLDYQAISSFLKLAIYLSTYQAPRSSAMESCIPAIGIGTYCRGRIFASSQHVLN